MNIIHKSPAELIKYAFNAKKHESAQIDLLANSITEFGFNVPVVIAEDGTIIAGHGRVIASEKLKLESIPCVIASNLTPKQIRRYRLLDNRISEMGGGYDMDILQMEIDDIGDDDLYWLFEIDIEIIEGKTNPDDLPEVDEKNIVTNEGDVWILGDHKIICGDCTDAKVIEKLLGDEKPYLMVTDPPYGVNYDASWRNDALDSDSKAVGKVLNDDRADWREAWALFPWSVAYVWHAGSKANIVQDSLEACKLIVRSQIVWVKNHLILSRGNYHPQHEPCLYSVKEWAEDNWQETIERFDQEHEILLYAVEDGKSGRWRGGRKQTTVWNIDVVQNNTGHSTQKPVECMIRPIVNNSKPWDMVYEPFSGSGTTIIASEQTKRKCRAIELSPEYVDMAVIRWQNFTGKKAILAGTDITFNSLLWQSRK